MSKRRLATAAVIVLSACSFLLPSSTPVQAQAWPTACGQHRDHVARMTVPCGEIDRAIHEAAYEFGLDEGRFRRIVSCESSFVNVAQRPGSQYIGEVQLGHGFVARRVPAFDNDPAVRVDLGQGMPNYQGPGTAFDTRNPFHNARVAAHRMADGDGDGTVGDNDGFSFSEWQCKG